MHHVLSPSLIGLQVSCSPAAANTVKDNDTVIFFPFAFLLSLRLTCSSARLEAHMPPLPALSISNALNTTVPGELLIIRLLLVT